MKTRNPGLWKKYEIMGAGYANRPSPQILVHCSPLKLDEILPMGERRGGPCAWFSKKPYYRLGLGNWVHACEVEVRDFRLTYNVISSREYDVCRRLGIPGLWNYSDAAVFDTAVIGPIVWRAQITEERMQQFRRLDYETSNAKYREFWERYAE